MSAPGTVQLFSSFTCLISSTNIPPIFFQYSTNIPPMFHHTPPIFSFDVRASSPTCQLFARSNYFSVSDLYFILCTGLISSTNIPPIFCQYSTNFFTCVISQLELPHLPVSSWHGPTISPYFAKLRGLLIPTFQYFTQTYLPYLSHFAALDNWSLLLTWLALGTVQLFLSFRSQPDKRAAN